MIITKETIERVCEEPEIINELLSLDNKQIVELGCGKAELTRHIAANGNGRRTIAYEIDAIQHAENMKIADLPNVTFKHGAAESIAEPDSCADVVFMFKSLHHVPEASMATAFDEIHRILKTDGFLYISEPIFAGEFNEILRLFHNEEAVRAAAFRAEQQAVAGNGFRLVTQAFFNAPMHFDDFAAFENRILGVTHTHHELSQETYDEVKARFESHIGADGANFNMPIRVDLLQAVK